MVGVSLSELVISFRVLLIKQRACDPSHLVVSVELQVLQKTSDAFLLETKHCFPTLVADQLTPQQDLDGSDGV